MECQALDSCNWLGGEVVRLHNPASGIRHREFHYFCTMNLNKKVLVGLSGGVDSSVAAYLLKEQGYDVTGVTMAIWDGQYQANTGKHSCYGPEEQEEIAEARELAEMLGIPFKVFDCSKDYKSLVLQYFKNEYLAGRTPNPCVKCNQLIKFGLLPMLAERDGLAYDYFATGHYAKSGYDQTTGRYYLKKGTDPKKDQSYFIHRLSQEQLAKILLPLGDMAKEEVKSIATALKLPASGKEESQDFYSGDFRDQPGDITDPRGKVLGQHQGIWNYTIGQRKGLGVAFSEPLYVISLDKEKNRVVVGTRAEAHHTTFYVNDINWVALPGLTGPRECLAKIRSAQRETEALIEPFEPGMVKVTFHQPSDGISPGQSAVFYEDDIVLGGGVIASTNDN
jgi:tRNA-specific 2-thiouridylase